MGKAGRREPGRSRRKRGTAGRLLLAVVTMINLGLALALSLQRRRNVLRAVEEDGRVRLLLERSTETKSGGPQQAKD